MVWHFTPLPHPLLSQVVRGGVADRAGLEDGNIVVEVNSINVENSTHEQVVDIIRQSGSSLELLVAAKSVYDQLKAKGVAITPMLLGPRMHTTATVEDRREDSTRMETPPAPAPARERVSHSRISLFSISSIKNYSIFYARNGL